MRAHGAAIRAHRVEKRDLVPELEVDFVGGFRACDRVAHAALWKAGTVGGVGERADAHVADHRLDPLARDLQHHRFLRRGIAYRPFRYRLLVVGP